MMRNYVIKYGLISGAVLGFLVVASSFFISATSDLSTTEHIGNAVMFIIYGVFIYYGVTKYRDEANGGYISYGQVLIKGILISLIGAVIYSFVWTVYSSVWRVNFEETYMEMMAQEMDEEGASNEEIAGSVEMIREFKPYYKNPVMKFFITIVEPILPGFMATLVLGFVLRRKKISPEIASNE